MRVVNAIIITCRKKQTKRQKNVYTYFFEVLFDLIRDYVETI